MVAVDRIAQAVDRLGVRFLRRVYTEAEARTCLARRQRAACLAARFAAKEAVMKALGCGLGPVGWRDIEVQRGPGGRPQVRLEGAAARLANEKGVERIHLSLSHDGGIAIACAVAWGGGEARGETV